MLALTPLTLLFTNLGDAGGCRKKCIHWLSPTLQLKTYGAPQAPPNDYRCEAARIKGGYTSRPEVARQACMPMIEALERQRRARHGRPQLRAS